MKNASLCARLLFACTLLYAVTTIAQTTKDPGKWTPEDIINTEFLRNASFSPDGNMVVWSKRRAVKNKDKFVADLYLTRLNQLKNGMPLTVQLTHTNENDYAPVFSKDNQNIYFLSSREKGKKLWKLSIYGGEASAVREFKNGIANIQVKDKNTLLFTANEGETLRDQKLKKKKDNVIVVEDTVYWKATRVFSYHLKTKTTQRITQNSKPVSSYAVSDNGKWLIYTLQMSPHFPADAQPDPNYFLKNLETGQVTQILNNFEFPSYNFQFNKENSGFYFVSEHASDPQWNGAGISELYYFDLSAMSAKKVPLDWELGIGRGFWIAGNSVVVSLANRATYKNAIYSPTKSGWKKEMLQFNQNNTHCRPEAVSKDGNTIVYGYSTSSVLPKYYTANRKGNKLSNTKEFVKLNKKLTKKRITKSEVITWKGYKNEEVTGILFYPENYEQGKKYPLILSIHGGPAAADTDQWAERWSTYPNIFAQKGAFVLKPNYHGSSNHGLAYVESIKNNYYVPEIEDITKGIKMLSDKGMVDMDKLGTMGWSNGAIITTMLTVKYPDMFKVAASGAGDVNWTSDYGTCRFGVSFDQTYFGGAPWDDKNGTYFNENYIIKSPLFELDKVKTPTIIFHGSEDRAVPRDQGWEHYRALQQIGKAPVRFLWFPGQRHGLAKISHQLRKMKEEIDWIDTYLFKTYEKENVALKKDSPLAQLLKKQKAASASGNFGTTYKNKLIPETVSVKKDSIAIGKFEVTNAQYKAYNSNHTYKATQPNHPVQVTFEEAKKYLAWLNQLTGENYRLPNAKETEELHKKALKTAQKENTLTYWAGYQITVDEVAILKEKFTELTHSLIMEVGSFAPVKMGTAEVYDVGGNLAEYSASGTTYGFSAYDYADKAAKKPVKNKYAGFRVIKENK